MLSDSCVHAPVSGLGAGWAHGAWQQSSVVEQPVPEPWTAPAGSEAQDSHPLGAGKESR